MVEDPEQLTWALGVRTRGGGRIRLSTGGRKVKVLALYKEGEYQASSPWPFGLAYSLGVLEAVGLPTPVLMRIPE